jgi:hypothetical protein
MARVVMLEWPDHLDLFKGVIKGYFLVSTILSPSCNDATHVDNQGREDPFLRLFRKPFRR